MDAIEKIRKEIERRRLHFNKEAEKYQALNNGYSQNCYGARDALRDIENFLDTIEEDVIVVGNVVEEGPFCQIIGPIYIDENAGLKVGDEVEIIITKKDEKKD